MHLVLVTAAESSKTAFYILGGLLAVYAVVLAGLGIRSPAFPGNEGGARMVILLTGVLVVLAIGAAILTS